MNVQDKNLRREVVQAVHEHMSGKITWREFLDRVPTDTEEDDIAEVLDLIEHIPKRGGFLGAREKDYLEYMANLEAAVRRLKANAGLA